MSTHAPRAVTDGDAVPDGDFPDHAFGPINEDGRGRDGRDNELTGDPPATTRQVIAEDPDRRSQRDKRRPPSGEHDVVAEGGGGSRRNDGRHHDLDGDPPASPSSDLGGGSRRRDGRDNEIQADPPTQPTSEDPPANGHRGKRRTHFPPSNDGRGGRSRRDGRDNEAGTEDPPAARADRAARLGGIQAMPQEAAILCGDPECEDPPERRRRDGGGRDRDGQAARPLVLDVVCDEEAPQRRRRPDRG